MGNIASLLIVSGSVGAALLIVWAILGKLGKNKSSDRWSGSVRKAVDPVSMPSAKKLAAKRAKKQNGEIMPVRLVRSMASMWRLGGSSQSRLQEMLVHSGIREKGAVEVFLGAKFALALALPAATAAFLLWGSNVRQTPVNFRNLFMYACIALIAGLMIPNIWLRGKAKRRIERIRLSLPDALDLMIVCVESGLGLDAALVRISREMSDVAPEFCEELVLLNLEISAGKPREECLRNLALRSGCDEVESLTARINQAAKFGTNLGNSLRIHSESLRQKRRQEAEERAAKTTVKLLFPLVFFIFPAIFVVILGPAVVKVAEMFL
jgi:tight adherence protein C